MASLDDAERVAAAVRLNTPSALGVRVLPDGSVALLTDLLFTRAICLGCHSWGYSRRFCFSDTALADRVFAGLQSEDDTISGHIAQRP